MSKTKNIILIGMPGSGKSTIGLLLAKALFVRFVDTDMMIRDIEKRSLQEILNESGQAYFENRESEVIQSINGRTLVIATGGSAVLLPDAMAHLKKIGEIVYLQAPLSLIEKRLWNIKTRGIVLGEGQSIEDLYVAREPIYRQYADLQVSVEGKTVDAGGRKTVTARELSDLTGATRENLESYVNLGLIAPDLGGHFPARTVQIVNLIALCPRLSLHVARQGDVLLGYLYSLFRIDIFAISSLADGY